MVLKRIATVSTYLKLQVTTQKKIGEKSVFVHLKHISSMVVCTEFKQQPASLIVWHV